jgi:hypothetical protein
MTAATRWDLINHLIQKYGYSSYLEIGVMETEQPVTEKNFDKIVCEAKVGVDPCPAGNPTYLMTSDGFFAGNRQKFDLVFIDGLHHEDQVTRDIINALGCLNPGGSIVVHDCLPRNELSQRVPREVEAWNGDVWKSWVKFRACPFSMYVVNVDEGCGVIRHDGRLRETFQAGKPLTYENLILHLQEWLNLVSWSDFLTME